jgi:hypothetical protein
MGAPWRWMSKTPRLGPCASAAKLKKASKFNSLSDSWVAATQDLGKPRLFGWCELCSRGGGT